MDDLGTVMMIWAHPDDETYLAGGLSASLRDAGQRVVCVTATRGEAGEVSMPDRGARTLRDTREIRTAELEVALETLGVQEHHWLDYPDGGCTDVDPEEAADRLVVLLNDLSPDTVVTFGPDGFTGHPDHRAVSGWTEVAVGRIAKKPRLLHAVSRVDRVDRELDENFGVFDLGLPRVCADAELALLLELSDALLDRKVQALLRQESQTAGLVDAVGLDRFRAWVATESFAEPETG